MPSFCIISQSYEACVREVLRERFHWFEVAPYHCISMSAIAYVYIFRAVLNRCIPFMCNPVQLQLCDCFPCDARIELLLARLNNS